jgi:glycosyltransferase involved in cell wall biosynthesis
MRFSVLLPTRNGAAFLRGCIESVLAQPLGPFDMELVISDNASEDGTADVIRPYLSDPRVRHERLSRGVPVTDNWNNALGMSRGEYLLLLGDDDALLPEGLTTIDAALRAAGEPDCLGCNGYLYVAPGSIFDNDTSYYKDPYHPYFAPEPTVLTREARRSLVRKMFSFVQEYPLNMQLTVFSRKIADKVRGGVFQPPFPDHYGLNALLVEAESFATIDSRIAVVGVSPKSFGHYYFSDDHEAGMRFLGSDSAFAGRLPGNEIWSSMYRWLLLLKKNYPDLLSDFEIDVAAYRKLQLDHWRSLVKLGRRSRSQAYRFALRLPWLEIPGALRKLRGASYEHAERLAREGPSKPRIEDVLDPITRLEGVRDISQFLRHVAGAKSAPKT